MDPRFLYLGTSWRREVSFRPQPGERGDGTFWIRNKKLDGLRSQSYMEKGKFLTLQAHS
jgi:hypothetical protein